LDVGDLDKEKNDFESGGGWFSCAENRGGKRENLGFKKDQRVRAMIGEKVEKHIFSNGKAVTGAPRGI